MEKIEWEKIVLDDELRSEIYQAARHHSTHHVDPVRVSRHHFISGAVWALGNELVKSFLQPSMETIYKGYIIAPETEPWAIKYGFKYIVYPEGNQPDNECPGFKTLEEAKDYIDNHPIK